jgi:hypothetical protein
MEELQGAYSRNQSPFYLGYRWGFSRERGVFWVLGILGIRWVRGSRQSTLVPFLMMTYYFTIIFSTNLFFLS